jgi:putative FmdB family regulatory protein
MPMYDFQCTICNHTFEIMAASLPAEHSVQCPICLAFTAKRLWTCPPGLVFVGEGWSKDGYSKPPPPVSSSGES